MSYKLFLDDYRQPIDCITYMHQRIGKLNPIYLEEWIVVKNYDEFVNAIISRGLPDVISFDHDLAEDYYSQEYNDMLELYDTCSEKTGAECAKWLVEHCRINNYKLPVCFIHSANPAGVINIRYIIEDYYKNNKMEK